MSGLNGSLGFWGATGIGIGAIIGTGIFVLIGIASGIAGPAVILSFIIAGFGTLLTFFSHQPQSAQTPPKHAGCSPEL
ncbi:MAG: hypothetical protein LUQ13_05250 [Methanomicrobiales archaeon]|nr:hypothetical protein [Methanomicrobiales archaeon]